MQATKLVQFVHITNIVGEVEAVELKDDVDE